MKLWIFKNGINVTEATFCIQNSLCGNSSRNLEKWINFVACDVCVVYCVKKVCSALYSIIQK